MKKRNLISAIVAVVVFSLVSSFTFLSGNSWRSSTAEKLDTFSKEINPLSTDILTYANKISPTKEDAKAAITTYDKHLSVIKNTRDSIKKPGFSLMNSSKNKEDYDKLYKAFTDTIGLDEQSRDISKVAVAALTWSESIPDDLSTVENAQQCADATSKIINEEMAPFNKKYSISIYKSYQTSFESIKAACEGITTASSSAQRETYLNDIYETATGFDAITQKEATYIKDLNSKYDTNTEIINTIRKSL